ncbi:MAG: MFS transporter [Planctomycetaceae bacterium]
MPSSCPPTQTSDSGSESGVAGTEADEGGNPADRRSAIVACESRNLIVLALHHVVLRVAWIFKTESVIMPAFMDAISGAGWLRGCLPLFNRVGQSVPSLAFSECVRQVRRKKRALFGFTVGMAAAFLVLSLLWFVVEDKRAAWLPAVFLLLYFLFFTSTGLNQLAFGTLQGKLIRPHRRGRLMGLAGTFGAVPAIVCAWFLLRAWVGLPDGGFGFIFLFAGAGFLVAAFVALAIVEPADERIAPRQSTRHIFRDALAAVRSDRDFRNFCAVAMLFMSAQMLFPHYQALGRRQSGFDPVQLMIWVVAQSAGAGIFSPLAGAIADRFGNRRALRWEIAAITLTPLLALALTGNGIGLEFYWLTFFLLGLVPVTMKTMMNYTLELCEPDKHPQYLSTAKVCMALPFALSPAFGLLIDAAGFEAGFVAISMLIFTGGLLTLRIPEPRIVTSKSVGERTTEGTEHAEG